MGNGRGFKVARPINYDECPDLKCPNKMCGKTEFVPVMRFKAVSPLVSASGHPEVVPGRGDVVQCAHCGLIVTIPELLVSGTEALAEEKDGKTTTG